MKKIILLSVVCLISCIALAQPQSHKITISGHINDTQTGETLIGAGVLSEFNNSLGAVTNNYGYYTLTITQDDYIDGKIKLVYSYVGYEQVIISFSSMRDTVINVNLKQSLELNAAVKTARKDAGITSSYIGAIEVPLTQIKNTPMLLEEADVLKSIQLLPGVQGGNEGFTGLYVRGGGPDENLIMLDGVPIYNVDHMFGMFSVFQPEAVKKVTLYKGAFPANYGGRVSSILDIRTNDGNMKETHGSISLGLVSNKLHLEGPIIKDKLSYSISARGMLTACYAPIIKAIMGNNYLNYYFYDLNGKLTWRLSDKDRLYFGVYNGKDKFKYSEYSETDNSYWAGPDERSTYSFQSRQTASAFWGNTVGSVRWNHIFNNKLFSNTTIAYNQYSMNMGAVIKETGKQDGLPYKQIYDINYNSGIKDISAKIDFDYTPSPAHIIKFGAEYTNHTFIPESIIGMESATETNEGVLNQYDSTFSIGNHSYIGNDLSIYTEDDFVVSKYLTVNPGLRLTLFNTQGRTYYSLQPRASVKLSFNDVYIKTGYARMSQYVHLLSSAQVSLPLDLWVPITKEIKPVTSDQYSLGLYLNKFDGWELSLEGYYKDMNNILEYKDGAFVLGSSGGWENKVAMGKGRAFGVEFMAEKKLGELTGWLAYTWAKSDRIFPDGSVNNGKRFPYKYDRIHSVNININWQVSKKVDLNATWSYATGGTTTLPLRKTGVYTNDGFIVIGDHIGSRNNYRLPASHRLNLGINLHNFKPKHEGIWSLGVYNAYNQMNPNFVFMSSEYSYDPVTQQTTERTALKKITVLPILPFVSYTYKF